MFGRTRQSCFGEEATFLLEENNISQESLIVDDDSQSEIKNQLGDSLQIQIGSGIC